MTRIPVLIVSRSLSVPRHDKQEHTWDYSIDGNISGRELADGNAVCKGQLLWAQLR